MKRRKIIVTVAPVCHVGKEIPPECKNPPSPEEIAELMKFYNLRKNKGLRR